jgi:DNA-binding NtrC family response regulator
MQADHNWGEQTVHFGRTIIVEDDAAIRQSLVDICRMFLEIEPEEAASAHEALDLLEASRPAVLLLDLVLPDAGGEWLVAEINARGWAEDVRVIIMSAQPDAEATAKRLHVYDTLAKPFSLSVVTEKLKNAGAH